MTLNRKRKAFTIIELVIVIAVIAILAAVLIPTFASIISRANESADIQAVRQMNMALLAESVENPPEGIQDVINILAAAGYNAKEKLIPVSSKHGFYWCKAANMITLIRDEGNDTPELIFPLENAAIDAAFGEAKTNWTSATDTNNEDVSFYDLEPSAEEFLPEIEEENAGEGIKDAASLKAALEAGGTVQLGAPIELADPVTIPDGVTVTLDLNGKTLTIGSDTEPEQALKAFYSPSASLADSDAAAVAEEPSYPSISVSGTLNINGGNGGTILTRAGYDGETPLGLVVNSTGTLNLNKVTVTVGTGAKQALYNDGGEVTATDCIFNEAEGATISYKYRAPIFNVGGIINMESVKIYSSELCTSGYPREVDDGYEYGKITIDKNSFLNLTGEGEKNVAPCGRYNAYNYIYYYGFTDNDNGDVFEYLGNSIDTTGVFFDLKAACEKGGTIDLKADFELNHPISVAHTTTINLCNNAELTISPYYSDIGFTGSGTLNIRGDGNVILDKPVAECFNFDIDNGGKVNIVGDGDTVIKVKQNPFTELFTALDRGYEFKNCRLTYSGETIAVNNAGVISLESNTVSIPFTNLSVPKGKTVNINLNGKTLNNRGQTITVPDTSTLNITNTAETTSQITSIGTTNIFNVEGGNLNLDNVELVNTNCPAYFLSYIMNNSSITASDVSIEEGKATLNKSIDEDGKITNKLTLAGNLSLSNDLTVSGNNTLEIVFKTFSLNNSGNFIVEGGGKLIVDGQTAKGTGSFTVKTGGTIEIRNNSTINKAITVNNGTLTVSGSNLQSSITANGGTLTVSDSTVWNNATITAENASKVTFTKVDVKMSQKNFYAFLEYVMASNDSTMTAVKFYEGSTHYLTVTKAAGKETTIAIDYDESLERFTLSSTLTIPVGCDVTLDMYDREIQIGIAGTPSSIEVNGTLTIDGGNISTIESSKITVTATGKLVLNAKNYFGKYDTRTDFLACVTVTSGGQVVDADGKVLKS